MVNLASWIRGITQLRSFKSTRIFIHLLLRVIKTLRAFAIITIFGLLTVSSTFTVMEMNETNIGQFLKMVSEHTFKTYLLTLGEFDTEIETTFEEQVFIFGTIFSTVIMLNLIIALMSDAYEEVISNITEQDAFETNLMIIDTEILFYWKRQQG